MLAKNFIAHRGWRQHYPENTLIAFREALAAGAANIEMDIQLSADGVPFVFHDASLDRLCQRPGMIWDFPAHTLDSLPAAEALRFGDRFAQNPMCRLSDVVTLLQAFPAANAYVELKAESLHHFGEQQVLDAVFKVLMPVARRCILISFELATLINAREQGWQRLGAVFDYWPNWQLAALSQMQAEVAFCDRNCVPNEAQLRELPLPVVIYEVGNALEAQHWFERGAAAVETYFIGELLQEFKLV